MSSIDVVVWFLIKDEEIKYNQQVSNKLTKIQGDLFCQKRNLLKFIARSCFK